MITVDNKRDCCGCGVCLNTCPQSCITMTPDSEGFFYPRVDKNVCINCGMCERTCPEINMLIPHDEKTQAFACKSIDEDVRKISSSGGVFYLLSRLILSKGGIIAGPLFDVRYRLHHCIIEDEQQLKQAVGSKYVQSDTGIIYKKLRRILETGTLVLFSGTPCQISGLKNYLGKDYENLVMQDIICHGVPSPMVWEKHVRYLESKGKEIKNIRFRDKTNGWRTYSLKANFEDGKEYCKPSYKEPYLKMFSRDLTLRPSCFSCPFKGKERASDITLGDFWGIENVCPQMDDNMGTSLAIVHTYKGLQLFNGIKDELIISSVDADEALKYNGAALRPATTVENREQFFIDVIEDKYEDVIARYCRDSVLVRTKRGIKRLIHR